MYDWIGANWIWLLLGIGLMGFFFRRGGMGCGMGGHGGQGGSEPAEKALPPSESDSHAGDEVEVKQPVAAPRGAHRHGGCC
jgi:hypothetical protein